MKPNMFLQATLAALPLGLAAFSISPQQVPARARQEIGSSDACTHLSALNLEDVVIASATTVRAGREPTGAEVAGKHTAGLPEFCRVAGQIHPSSDSDIGFEVWLPTESWNGRLHGVGIGGFAGVIDYDVLATTIAGGQVGLATDTGHRGGVLDSSWAKGHPEKVRDYGTRAVHVSTVAAKAIIRAFYGRAQTHSYWVGCSGGGRQGLMEAAYYPEDYDGVLAGAPAASWTGLAMAMTNALQAQEGAGAAIRNDQMPLLESEVLRQCDAVDGLRDGLVSDPRRCAFDPTRIDCETSSSPSCFAPQQIAALQRIYAGPRDASGRQITRTFLPAGAESGPGGWGFFISMTSPGRSLGQRHADGLFLDLVQSPFPKAMDFDFGQDPARLQALISKEVDAPADLTKFFARGGKLLLWHGWADPAIPPEATIDYFDAVRKQSGGRAAGSSQLFMVPNVQHCNGGNGPSSFGQVGAPAPGDRPVKNMVVALQRWNERGETPDAFVGVREVDTFGHSSARSNRQTLLCAWPKHPSLSQGGNPERATDYRCVSGRN